MLFLQSERFDVFSNSSFQTFWFFTHKNFCTYSIWIKNWRMYLKIVYHGVYFDAWININITFLLLQLVLKTAALLELNVPKVVFSFNFFPFAESGSRPYKRKIKCSFLHNLSLTSPSCAHLMFNSYKNCFIFCWHSGFCVISSLLSCCLCSSNIFFLIRLHIKLFSHTTLKKLNFFCFFFI